MQKQKRPKLSKEQVAQQMAMRAEADRFKKIIKENLYPVLQKAGSLMDAQTLCTVISKVMLAKCNQYWVDKKVSDLKLLEELANDGDAKDREIYTGVIEAINDLPITDAQKLLQGMGGALDGYTRKIAEGKQMADLPVEEIITG